jgi:feruloyl esterase
MGQHFKELLCLSAIAGCLVASTAPVEALAADVTSTASSCKALMNSDFSQVQDAPTQVTSAELVEVKSKEPSYCRVQGYIAPQVGFELRLPTANWNGRFMEVGCGGACGVIQSDKCDIPVRRGYACIASDMGHKGTGDDALWAYNNLQTQIDFGYRATHVAALAGKAITKQYYQASPRRAYFVGCSTGGYQGVTEAQRFPWDFDGILAGAPDIDENYASLRALWAAAKFQDKEGKPRLDRDALQLVHQAVLARCDMDDGVKDGIISDPLSCHFDPKELVCKSGEASSCLTDAQAQVVRDMYSGPTNSKGEKTSSGGFLPGSELMWNDVWPLSATEQSFKYLIYGYTSGKDWKYTDFDFDHDHERFGLTPWYENSNPDLRRFKRAGGKLIIYHGGVDTVDLPGAVIDYYESVERTMGGRSATEDFFRFFIIPGMTHCSGGEGAFAIDYLRYLEAWVENGEAPEKLIGAHVKTGDLWSRLSKGDVEAWHEWQRRTTFPLDQKLIEFTRPIYPYPTFAKYKGSGDPNSAESFVPAGASVDGSRRP